MELESGTQVAQRYEVQQLLGRGGMGAVYQVADREAGTLRALKVLSRVDPALRQRLLREGRLQGSLDHPGVVRVLEVVDVQGHPGLVLELVPDGRSLVERLREGRPSLSEVDALAEGLFAAVGAAHAHGLVHRDLKPANILLEEGAPRISDFGLAKALGDHASVATATGALLGTPAYMAPEQVQDARTVDARADLFSLGAVLYELLTGNRAFPGSPTEAMWRAAQGELGPLGEGPREAAVRWALRVDPDDRPDEVESLAEAWRGERVPPEPLGGSLAGGCLPPEALVERAEEPDVVSHVASCVRCRMELRMYEAFTAPAPARPRWPWRAWLLGGTAGTLGALALATAVVGSLSELAIVGPFLLPLLLLPGVSGAVHAQAVVRAREGEATSLLGWFVGPAMVLAVGAVATALGAMQAAAAIEGARAQGMGPELVQRLAAQGSNVALSTWTIGYAVGLVGLALPLAALAVVARDQARGAGFDGLPVGVALVGGAALWLGEGSGAGLLAFVAAVGVGAVLGLLPRGPVEGVREVVAVGAAVLVALVPVAARVELLRRAVTEGPPAEVWVWVVDGWSLAWAALGLVLGASVLRGGALRWQSVLALLALAGLAGGPTLWTVATMRVLGTTLLGP